MGNLSKINLNALLILGILAPNFRQLYSCVGGGGSGGGTVCCPMTAVYCLPGLPSCPTGFVSFFYDTKFNFIILS